jgi:hypothetical protein
MSSSRHEKHDEFDRLLAAAHRGRMPESSACPDAGTIAAYMDSGLDAGERASFERHAADCPRCTEAIALIAAIDEHSNARATTPLVVAWPWWRLLVPVATVLIVFVVWRELPLRESEAPVSETSESTPVSPTARRAEETVAPTEGADSATKPGEPARRSPAIQPRPRKADGEQRAPQAKEEEQRRQAYAVPPSTADSDSAVSVYLGGQARQGASGDRKEAVTVVPPTAPEAAPEAGLRAKRGDEALAKVAAPVQVTSADNAAAYRVMEERTVERSTDGGRTWVTEPTPVVTGLRVGSAPSGDICWLAGAAGLVLRRSADGAWHLVPLPQPLAIVRITATSAIDAVVSTANGQRWQTSDGGGRWERLDDGL